MRFVSPESAGKAELVSQLLAAKEASGKTFTQISQEIGRTNLFTTQLFFNQVGHALYPEALHSFWETKKRLHAI